MAASKANEKMAPLWTSASVGDWEAAWASYESIVEAQGKDQLVELDVWIRTELPATLHARDPSPFITQAELVKLMEWKLKKGKWRPQLMKYVTDLSDKQVKDASTAALKELKAARVKAAVEALAALKGVGPATASAVLAAYDESVPFMGDEALEAIATLIGPRKYTLSHYLSFHKELTAKAKWLTTQAKQDDETDQWTPQRVQLCLYTEAKGTKKASTKTALPAKRKAVRAVKKPTSEEEEAPSKDAIDSTAATDTGRRTRRKTERYAA